MGKIRMHDKGHWTKPLRGRNQTESSISRLTSGFPPSFIADRIGGPIPRRSRPKALMPKGSNSARNACSPVRTKDFIKAVSKSREPKAQKAIRAIFTKTTVSTSCWRLCRPIAIGRIAHLFALLSIESQGASR